MNDEKDMEMQEKGQNPISVPYIVHEMEITRMELVTKRLWIAIIVAIIMLFVTNAVWLLYISQYDYVSYTVTSGSTGNASYIGNDGNIYNGESCSEKANTEEQKESEGAGNS